MKTIIFAIAFILLNCGAHAEVTCKFKPSYGGVAKLVLTNTMRGSNHCVVVNQETALHCGNLKEGITFSAENFGSCTTKFYEFSFDNNKYYVKTSSLYNDAYHDGANPELTLESVELVNCK